MKKQKSLIVLGILAVFLIGGVIYLFLTDDTLFINKDERNFRQEYEKLNGKATGREDRKYLSVTIPEKNWVQYTSTDEVLQLLEDGTGIIYFGFPECPWCRSLVPVLFSAMEEAKYQKLYYCNALEERDSKHLDETGTVVTDKKGSKNYAKILSRLADHLDSYEGLNNEAIKRLYFPTVVFVKDGQVVDYHEGTIDSQKDPYQKLSDKQANELKNELIGGIKKVQGLLCTDDNKC